MKKTILIVPGSLRKNSSSYKLVDVIAKYLPDDFEFKVFDGTGELPHFNDADEPSDKVLNWRSSISEAAGVLFITPEYAYGVPGTLKNALDWTVSSGELVNKPSALITASTGGDHAHKALLLILGALTSPPGPGCELLISFIRAKLDSNGKIIDPALETRLRDLVYALIANIKTAGESGNT